MIQLHFDYETRSRIDLIKHGLDIYSRHHTTKIIMLSYKFVIDGVKQPTKYWDIRQENMPEDFLSALADDSVELWAHNAAFERKITKEKIPHIKIKNNRWRCTMALAHSLSLPGSLDKVGKIIRLPPEYMKKAGKKYIDLFCKPTKVKGVKKEFNDWTTHPKEWEEFKEYSIFDTEAETKVHELMDRFNMPKHEWQTWHLDQIINERGFPIDTKLIKNAVRIMEENQENIISDLKKITYLRNPNSDQQFLVWAKKNGYQYGDLRKNTVTRALNSGELPAVVDEALRLRAFAKKTSTKKYYKIRDFTNPEDERLRYTKQFAGAGRTWRWAGRVTQFDNLPRPAKEFKDPEVMDHLVECIREGTEQEILKHGNMMVGLSSALRAVIRAPKGFKLAVADYASIESRVLGDLTDCRKIIDVFRAGLCVYKSFGVYLYGVPYEEITKAQRDGSKPGALGAGYRLSGGELIINSKGDEEKTGLWGYAESLGVKATREECHHAVKVFREVYWEVVKFWYDIERAVKNTIKDGVQRRVGQLVIEKKPPFLRILLPSGRHINYLRPRLEMRKTPYGEMKETITYEGFSKNKHWVRLSTHGGKLTENIVQAYARDLLADGLKNAHKAGFAIIGHVHDEIITLVPEDKENAVKELIAIMSQKPKYTSNNLILDAAGYESIYYKKD